MATKLGRMVTYLEGLPNHKVTQRPYHVVLQIHVTNKNHISTIRVPTVTKLRRIVAPFDGLLHIKSHNPLIT